MNIEIRKAGIQEKPVLRNLVELYRYDSSEFDGEDVGEHGLFVYRYFDHYWTEPGRHAFIVRVSGRLAGFAMVRAIGVDESEPIHRDRRVLHHAKVPATGHWNDSGASYPRYVPG